MLSPKYNPEHYEDAQFLGRGTCTVSQIFYTSPSRCAVADSCAISIDRRMTAGETWDSCLERNPAHFLAFRNTVMNVKVSMYMYGPLHHGQEKYTRQNVTSQHGSTKKMLLMFRH